MSIYNLIEHSYNYSKIQIVRDEPNNNSNNNNSNNSNNNNNNNNNKITDSKSLKFKERMARRTTCDGNIENNEIAYHLNVWRTLDIPLITVKLILF